MSYTNDRRRPSTVAETLGVDSPGPAALYRMKSSVKERPVSMGRKDYIQTSYLSEIEYSQKNIPPPANYHANHDMVEPSRYRKIGFGYGMRMDPLLLMSSHKMQLSPSKNPPMYVNVPESHVRYLPGPGQYKLPSKFDKFQGMDVIAKKLIKKLNKEGHSVPNKK